MKKVLPIKINPNIHSYTQHGFLHAIIGSEDKVCYNVNDSVAEIYVDDYEKYNWEKQTEQLSYTRDSSGKLVFKTNRWNLGMNMAFWRECLQRDELVLRIEKQLYSNAWSSINVFITSEVENEKINLNTYKVSIGHFEKDGIFYSVEKGIHKRINTGFKKPILLKLIKEDNDVFMQSYDGESLGEKKLIYQLDDCGNEYKIGFSINLGNSAYYEWMFSNYIQVFSRPNDSIPIDYIVNAHKDWCIHTANPLVDYNRIKKSDLVTMKLTQLEYVKLQIDLDNYVEDELNDNLNKHKSDDKGKYFHQNLIYGYDDENRCLYTLYYDMGKVSSGMISYDDYQSDRNKGGTNFLYMMHYNPCSEYFSIDAKRIANLFNEFRNSENISLYESFYNDGFLLGLSCYKYLISEKNNRICSDIRIIYLFFERAEINKNRIEYLYLRGMLPDKAYFKIAPIIDTQVTDLKYLKNWFIKKLYTRENIKDKTDIEDKLIKIVESESIISAFLVESLRDKL